MWRLLGYWVSSLFFVKWNWPCQALLHILPTNLGFFLLCHAKMLHWGQVDFWNLLLIHKLLYGVNGLMRLLGNCKLLDRKQGSDQELLAVRCLFAAGIEEDEHKWGLWQKYLWVDSMIVLYFHTVLNSFYHSCNLLIRQCMHGVYLASYLTFVVLLNGALAWGSPERSVLH